MNLLLEIEKVVVEGAGAAGIAALLEHPDRLRDRQVGVVLSGGNVDPRLLASVIMRGLVRSGRLTRLHIEIPDVPGHAGPGHHHGRARPAATSSRSSTSGCSSTCRPARPSSRWWSRPSTTTTWSG